MRMTLRTPCILAAIVALAAGCSSSTGGGGYVGGGGAGGGGGGGTTGDSTKNTASISATDDQGGSQSGISTDTQSAPSSSEVKAGENGAQSAGDILQGYAVDSQSGTFMTFYIDTAANPLPATVQVGEPNGTAWVTYTAGAAVYNSKDTGTITIDQCPTPGQAVTGKLNGVVVENANPDFASDPTGLSGVASLTLDGPFNLVMIQSAGALTCKQVSEPDTSGGGADAGGGGGGTGGETFGVPAGSTCDVVYCADPNANCCPYMPCIETEYVACAAEVESCAQACSPADFECQFGCVGVIATCINTVPDKCGASAACKAGLEAVNTCQQTGAGAVCADIEDEDAADKCFFDNCCAEIKQVL